MGAGASCAASAITVQFDEAQPYVAGQHVSGTVIFNNTFEKGVKLRRIYAEFVGEAVYTTKQYNGSGYRNVTNHKPFFRQSINLQEQQDAFVLTSDYCSWPISFSLPTFLPPSLNQLSTRGPYIRYMVRVVFERPKIYKMNLRREFSIIVIAHPPSYSSPSFLPVEGTNKNRSDVTLHAVLIGQAGPLKPGDKFLLNVELHNPNHVTIKCLPIDLVQHRAIGMGGHCALTIPMSNLPHLQEFSGEHYVETLELTIPMDDRIIPSFYYMPATFSGKPIAVEYMLKLEVKIHGFFKNFILNIPVVVHPKQSNMDASMEDEEPPPSYDSVVATQ